MAAKSSFACLFQEKEVELETFYYSPFPVRFVYCNVCVCDFQLTSHVSKEENAILAKQTGKTRTFPRGALHHECITLLNASKYYTGLLLDNPTGP